VKSFNIAANRQRFDADGEIASSDGWVVLRAWNDGSNPLVLDIYPYATTGPIYLDLPGGPPQDRQSAAYFVAWLDRTIADAAGRTDYRTEAERDGILKYLREARTRYAAASASHQ
jgi:hypothetical protein